MVQPTYPGVYVQEVESPVRPVTAVATSITAFIDYFAEGPMNVARDVFGLGEFQRIYGGINSLSEGSYAIAQFFNNGGAHAVVVRVAAPETGGGALPRSAAIDLLDASSGTAATISASTEGTWANGTIRLRVSENPDGTFNVNVARYAGRGGRAPVLIAEPTYTSLTLATGHPRNFADVVNDDSEIVRVSGLGTEPPVSNGTTGAVIAALPSDGTFVVRINQDGAVIGEGRVTLTLPAGLTSVRELRPVLQQALRSAEPRAVGGNLTDRRVLAGITVDLLQRVTTSGVDEVFVIRTSPAAPTYHPLETITFVEDGGTTAGELGLVAGAQASVQEYVLAGGNVGAQASSTNGIDGERPGVVDLRRGLAALEEVDLFNLLALPRAADLDEGEMQAILTDALAVCEARRAFLLVDVPESVDNAEAMRDWIASNSLVRHPNGAVFFPRVLQPDPHAEYRGRSVGPSGTVAGVFARIDARRGVWKAPAGVEAQLRGVSGLDGQLTDARNGMLNPLGINCLRDFPIHGRVVWGARTLSGADEAASQWKYVPVRRLALFLEESLFRGTKWVVFEPNDEPLWAKIRKNVGAFMLDLFRQGAFQGDTPDKAFFVKCDYDNNPATDRNRGIVNIDVGFAPLKPAEFVYLRIQQIPEF